MCAAACMYILSVRYVHRYVGACVPRCMHARVLACMHIRVCVCIVLSCARRVSVCIFVGASICGPLHTCLYVGLANAIVLLTTYSADGEAQYTYIS